MKKIAFVLALAIISLPAASFAMTVADVEQQLSIYKNQAPSVLGASAIGASDIKPMPPVPMPPVPAPKEGSTDVPRLQLAPEQVKVLMQALKYADPKGSSMIIKSTIKPGQTDSVNSQDGSVKKLQLFLNATGCNLPTTGKFGAMTRKCVMEFQKRKGLKADGIVGPNFRKEMQKEIDAVTSTTTATPTQ
jgi:murein L,D-transpeptidase YcbB/YkuD